LYEFQKTVRRHKVGFAAAAAVIVALTAGVAVSAWQAAVAIRARNDANAARRQEAAQRQAAQEESRKAQAARSDAEEKTRQRDVNLYFNRIALAYREMTAEPPDIRGAVELLAQCPESMRSWEWNYLQRAWRTDSFVLDHLGVQQLNTVSYSPDS